MMSWYSNMSLYSKVHSVLVRPFWERRNGLGTREHLRFLMKSELWSEARLRSYQIERLRLVLRHAYEHTQFYKKRFNEAGFNPYEVDSFDPLKRIPPVTRQDLNDSLKDMIADTIPENERHFDATGGSTGLPTKFARDNACLSIKKASEYRFNMWAGWNPGEKILAYWPALTDFSGDEKKGYEVRSLLYTRNLKLFSGQLNEKILSDHVQAFRWFRPHLIRAFPSALQRFAEYVSQLEVVLPRPKAIICVGEPLLQSQRAIFSKVFGCDVFNCYVSRECGNIACECSAHDGLHIAEELVYLEIENQGKGEFGEIFLTDLWNMGMPLIRYRIQDAAKWLKGDITGQLARRNLELDASPLTPVRAAALLGMLDQGILHAQSARQVLELVLDRDMDPQTLAEMEGLTGSDDEQMLLSVIDQVLSNHQGAAAQAADGSDKAVGFLMGQVLKASEGSPDPKHVRRLLCERIRCS